MRIRRFFELFDTEDIKSRHEIDWLSGNLASIGKNIEHNFKDESIGKFVTKISQYNYPFFMQFDKADRKGELEFNDFKIYTKYDEDDKHWAFVAASDSYMVVFGIKINGVNNYDIYIYFDDAETPDDEQKNPGAEYQGVTYTEVVGLIKEIYIPFLIDAGFEELLDVEDKINTNN
jgi:hypothetical protein